MKVVILMENSTCRDTVACAHGLSMYIETDKHKILFDMGPDAQFIDNARALGVDLTQVDIAFLSHAHNDHCGGLEAFLKLNDRAKVYMQKAVWGQYYVVTPSKCAYIGMDAVLKNYEDRFVLCDGVQKLDEELTVFSAVPGRELVDAVGEKLRGDKVAHYFTGHCTGKEAYERLKRKLGDRLGEMPAGSDFTV